MTKEKANRNEVVGMFLTYCRKTIVNARTDVLRERKRRRNREVLFCDLRRSELESLADWQDVPERETVFDAAGKPIGVTDKDLADALEKLCPEEQAIILLSYFAGWSDRRIGEDMGFPRSTVQNRRARALARLADILTEGLTTIPSLPRQAEMPLLPGRCSITSTTSWTDSAPGSTPTRMASGTTASTSR